MSLIFKSAVEIAKKILSKEVSPVELVNASFQRIDARDEEIKAFISLDREEAIAKAKKAEEALSKGEWTGPLHGIPIAIKEGYHMRKGRPWTLGYKGLKGFVPDATSPSIERLERAGAIILGTTNVPEFLHRGTTDNTLIGPTSTPFAAGRNAGGSSGGSAAAVADGMAFCAQGSDGGGSIRIPSSCCGVFGLCATQGVIPNSAKPDAFLHTPFIYSGPITRTVEDAELLLEVMAGPDRGDPFSHPPIAFEQELGEYRIAYSPDLDIFPVDPSVLKVVEKAVKSFPRVDEVKLGLKYSQRELSEVWQRLNAPGMAFGKELFESAGFPIGSDASPYYLDIVEKGRAITVLDRMRDNIVRTHVFERFEALFDTYDFLVSPTLAVPPVPNQEGGKTVGPTEINGEAVDPLIGWCMTYLTNFTGHPSCSIPAGLNSDGLPVGMQIIARRFEEGRLLKLARFFEECRPWKESYARVVETSRS